VGVAAEAAAHLETVAKEWSVPARRLGVATGARIEFAGVISVSVEVLRQRWETALDRLMEG
jgi:hypothetical protein